MSSVALAAGCFCVAAWLYLLLAQGRFWRLPLARETASHSPIRGHAPRLAAVIPARNEAEVIGRSISSLLRQNCEPFCIFVVDDNSTDGTASAARAAAALQPEQVTILSGRPLPPGWSGKVWAMQQGIEEALRLPPDFLLLTDADVEHAPDTVSRLLNIAEDGGYDLASFMVKLHCRAVPEKLLIPAFVFFFFMLYPPEWVHDPRRQTAGAAGGSMLLRRAALERIGGIASIRDELIDDCALAREVKQAGGKIWLGATPDTYSIRPYDSFAEIERMIARTAFNQLRHSAWLLLGTVLGMLLLFTLPLGLLAGGSVLLAIIGATAYALMSAIYLPMVRFYRLNPLWALSLPFAGIFYTAATVHSAAKYWTSRGGEWKGRAQDERENVATLD